MRRSLIRMIDTNITIFFIFDPIFSNPNYRTEYNHRQNNFRSSWLIGAGFPRGNGTMLIDAIDFKPSSRLLNLHGLGLVYK